MEAKTSAALEKARKTVNFFNSATDKDVKDNLRDNLKQNLNRWYMSYDSINDKFILNDMLPKLELYNFQVNEVVYKSGLSIKKSCEDNGIETISAEYVDNLFAGIFFIKGFVNENININEAENELNNTITNLTKDVTDREISKAKNNIKTDFEQDIIDIETSTDLLVNFTNFRDTFEIFESKIENVKRQEITQLIAEIFRKENRSKLIYSKRI